MLLTIFKQQKLINIAALIKYCKKAIILRLFMLRNNFHSRAGKTMIKQHSPSICDQLLSIRSEKLGFKKKT